MRTSHLHMNKNREFTPVSLLLKENKGKCSQKESLIHKKKWWVKSAEHVGKSKQKLSYTIVLIAIIMSTCGKKKKGRNQILVFKLEGVIGVMWFRVLELFRVGVKELLTLDFFFKFER